MHFSICMVSGCCLTQLETEGIRIKVQSALVNLSAIQGHTLGTEVLSNGPLGLVYQLLDQAEALV